MSRSEGVYVDDATNLSDGDRRLVTVDGRDVCVVRHEGEYYAFQNRCPHFDGPVGKGEILPEIVLEEAETAKHPRERYGDRWIVTCPWHGWDFDLETGEHCGHSAPEFDLTTYEVEIECGEVYVRTD